MRKFLSGSITAFLLTLPVSCFADDVVGFPWHATIHTCSGLEFPVFMVNPTGKILYVESLRIFLGVNDPETTGKTDVFVEVQHSNGGRLEKLSGHMYKSVYDTFPPRTYATPWKFLPGEGIIVTSYCNRWGSGIGSQVLHYEVSIVGFTQ